MKPQDQQPKALQIGWASTDITPPRQPVLISGQFYARVSEGVDDPLSATALFLTTDSDQVCFVSCDLVTVPDNLATRVREALTDAEGIDAEKVVFHATHTHAAPEVRPPGSKADGISSMGIGVEIDVCPVEEYLDFLVERLATLIREAWKQRAPGAISFGLSQAVVGRNRRWVDDQGIATMYRLKKAEDRERFRHIEGYEDHSLNLLTTYDTGGNLTGVLINLPSPSQESQHSYLLSADFWCETRMLLREQLGHDVFILPQCSAAGELTSLSIFEQEAQQRMLDLQGRTSRQEVACRLQAGVMGVLPALARAARSDAVLCHEVVQLDLPGNTISEKEAREAEQERENFLKLYHEEIKKLEALPAEQRPPRWYVSATQLFRRANWFGGAVRRFQEQQKGGKTVYPATVHVVRLNEIAFATNPFEYYLDFGIQIKVRSPFLQTFLVQLAGGGTYVPSPRSVAGGGYGSVPASNPVGPEGGQLLAEKTIKGLRRLAPADIHNGVG